MQRHGFAVGDRKDKGCGDAALRANGAKDVRPFVTLIARSAWAGPAPGPDAGQCALLANARFVLEPDFDRLVLGALREPCGEPLGEVFLNASWAPSSLSGWRGRTVSRR